MWQGQRVFHPYALQIPPFGQHVKTISPSQRTNPRFTRLLTFHKNLIQLIFYIILLKFNFFNSKFSFKKIKSYIILKKIIFF